MTAAALLSRETAIADIKRRPQELHQYGDTLTDAVILRSKIHVSTLRKMVDRMLHDLTTWDRAEHGRVIPATAGVAGLRDLLVMILQGYHRVSLTESAAVQGVSLPTSQRRMADLRDAGILRAVEIGRKGESVTRYEIGPAGARMLADAHAWLTHKREQWDRWRAERKGRKVSRRSLPQHIKKIHRENPPPSRVGPTEPPHQGGPATRAATAPVPVPDQAADAELVAAYRAGAAERRARAQTAGKLRARKLAAGFDKAFRGAAG
jgi:hypothetical protein